MTERTTVAGPRAEATGRVEDFDAGRGLGTVRADDGSVYGFHCTAIADGSRAIDPGSAVVFEVGPAGPGRWEAKALRPVPTD